MWEGSKYIILLVMVSITIVTIDQYVKKGRRWKTWVGASLLACLVFTFMSVASPPDLPQIFPDGETSQDSPAPAKSSPQNEGDHDGQSAIKQPKTEEAGNQQPTTGEAGNQQPTTGEAGNQQPTTGEAGNQQPTTGQTESGHNDANSQDSQNSQQTAVLSGDILLPVDEASLNPSFKEFRDSFLAAISRKDLNFLKKHVSPNIRYSFGTNNGIDGFLKEWQLNKNPDKSGVWSELTRVLELGGSFDKKKAVFTAPYVFSNFPSNLDSFEYAVVIRDNVSIHSNPDPNSPIIMGLSYKILKLVDSKSYKSAGGTLTGESPTWRKVETPSGVGFINSAYLRSPIDYRAQFRQEDGEWKMILFVAGD